MLAAAAAAATAAASAGDGGRWRQRRRRCVYTFVAVQKLFLVFVRIVVGSVWFYPFTRRRRRRHRRPPATIYQENITTNVEFGPASNIRLVAFVP